MQPDERDQLIANTGRLPRRGGRAADHAEELDASQARQVVGAEIVHHLADSEMTARAFRLLVAEDRRHQGLRPGRLRRRLHYERPHEASLSCSAPPRGDAS